MSKSAWGKIGAWAAEAEREEQEEREEAAKAAAEAASRGFSGGGDSQNYPSLKDAIIISASKQTKKKTKMTLQEFNLQGLGSTQRGLTHEEMLLLPTGPKDRSSGDDMQHGGRHGGGFSNYTTRTGPGRMRDRDSDGSDGFWGREPGRRSYGGFEDDRRRDPPPGRVSDSDQISRADEVDNWATMKKSLPSFNSGPVGGPGRPSRYTSLGEGSGGFSRADEVDNWAAIKKPMPPPAAKSSSFGSGLRDSRPEPEKWTRDWGQDRQRLVLDQPKGGEDGEEVVKVNKPNPFGAARPREEVLAEKGLDWKKLDSDIDAKKVLSRPGSSQSSRSGSSQSGRLEGPALPLQEIGDAPVKPKPKVNPFGNGKPREVLLLEKGLDWRKIDSELERRRVERPDSEEEKNLKEEIEHLKKESLQCSGESQSDILEQIRQKEKDLELLTCELDDKVRFGQKPNERPGSGAGRFTGHPERLPSQSAAHENPRGGEFMDRPRSRGTGDLWSRPVDDRRTYHGGRGRGFLGNRNLDRSRSRERW